MPILPYLDHPENFGPYQGLNIFDSGRHVILSPPRTRALFRFLTHDAPDSVVRKDFPVWHLHPGTTCITLVSQGDRVRRVVAVGENDRIYGAFIEEDGRKIFLGWEDPKEWGVITMLNLVCEVARKEGESWLFLKSPKPLGGLVSPGQEARIESARFFRVVAKRSRKENVFSFHPSKKFRDVGEVVVRGQGKRWKFMVPFLPRILAVLHIIDDHLWGRIQVVDFYGGSDEKFQNRLNRYIIGQRKEISWAIFANPICIESSMSKQGRRARTTNLERALSADLPDSFRFAQLLTVKIGRNGWVIQMENGQVILFKLSPDHVGMVPLMVLGDEGHQKIAFFWLDEAAWKRGDPPLRQDGLVFAEKVGASWIRLKKPLPASGIDPFRYETAFSPRITSAGSPA